MFKLIKILILCLFSGFVFCGGWAPKLNFSIEGSTESETLTFISGAAYVLEYSNKILLMQDKKNFYCFDTKEIITSQVIINILNKKLKGDHTSEVAIEKMIVGLTEKYPCID